jgi:hypothetical protein
MVLDILLELLAYLGILGLKKKKKKNEELKSPEIIDPNLEKDQSGRTSKEGISVCAGCSRIVEKDAVYELGKSWCVDCYKSHVLKIQE